MRSLSENGILSQLRSRFKGGVAELVKRLLSTPKVWGSNHREAQKMFKRHFECDFSATLSLVCIHHDELGWLTVAGLTARGVCQSLLTANHTCRQSEDETLWMTPTMRFLDNYCWDIIKNCHQFEMRYQEISSTWEIVTLY